jgi:hypothetical protein
MPKSKKSDKVEKQEKPAAKSPAKSPAKATAKTAPAKAVGKPAKSSGVEKPATKAKSATKAVKEPVTISNEDIALRAYFLAERRRNFGWPGDEHSDWVDAESQLREEAERKAKGRK